MSLYPLFLKWGTCKSKDEKKPDIVKIKIVDTDTFETEFTINVTALVKENKEWIEMNIPLKSHESPNSSLLDQWNKAVKEKIVKKDAELIIKTHLAKSRNDRNIRRFSLEKS